MHTQRVALITGGAKRVGRAVVEHLAETGWRVIFTYYTSKVDADELIESWTSRNGEHADNLKAVYAPLNDNNWTADSIVKELISLGRLDLFLHNASLYKPDNAANNGVELNQQFQRIHVESFRKIIDATAPMLRGSCGSVVTMLDVMVKRPLPGYSMYCASKAALANLTLAVARELAPEVTVNGIAPGVVDWPDDMPQPARDAYLKNVPLGRAGTPADVAKLVEFLSTDGKYITGQIIALDGGRSLGW